MMNTIKVLAVATCLLGPTLSPGAVAQDNGAVDAGVRKLSIGNMTCRSLLQASGTQRDLLLALFHGYVAGKQGTPELDTVRMSFLTDAVVDHCIDNPDDRVLAAFAASAKAGG
jgi:hypothetical protein